MAKVDIKNKMNAPYLIALAPRGTQMLPARGELKGVEVNPIFLANMRQLSYFEVTDHVAEDDAGTDDQERVGDTYTPQDGDDVVFGEQIDGTSIVVLDDGSTIDLDDTESYTVGDEDDEPAPADDEDGQVTADELPDDIDALRALYLARTGTESKSQWNRAKLKAELEALAANEGK